MFVCVCVLCMFMCDKVCCVFLIFFFLDFKDLLAAEVCCYQVSDAFCVCLCVVLCLFVCACAYVLVCVIESVCQIFFNLD